MPLSELLVVAGSPWLVTGSLQPQPQDLELPRRREDRWRGRAEHPSLIQGSGRVAGGSPQETSVPGAHAPTLPGGSR